MIDIARTAVGVAGLRAVESQRPDRLFDDPYAAVFAPVTGDALERAARSTFRLHIVVRTKFYDDYLMNAVTSGCRQVVLVAAGLDTRAFRLPWPADVTLYELDLPDMLARKEEVLTAHNAVPAVARTVVPVDLRDPWAEGLVAAGFDPAVPTAWLVEGLLVYLTSEEAGQVLATVTALSASGSQIGCEYRNRDILAQRAEHIPPELAKLMALWKGGVPTADWLSEHGWQVSVHDGKTLAELYGRETDVLVGSFLTGVRP